MKTRMVNWGNGPLQVALLKGERICTSCTSITNSEDLKVRGPGCTKCEPDKAVDEIVPSDHSEENEIMLDAQAKLFFYDSVDMVKVEDLDPVEDWDVVTDAEINLELVMSDEERDPTDEIVIEDMDPVLFDEKYKVSVAPYQIFDNARKAADAVLFEDAA